jgi:hypothetical protein
MQTLNICGNEGYRIHFLGIGSDCGSLLEGLALRLRNREIGQNMVG